MEHSEQSRTHLDIVVINLARSVERRKTMEQLLAPLGLPYRFFEAVDGRAGWHPLFSRYDERQARLRFGYRLLPGELGCFASHYRIWQECAENGRPVLICEDDVTLKPSVSQACEIIADKIEHYGLLRLSAHLHHRVAVCEETKKADLKIVRYEQPPLGTSCYALSSEAARKLLAFSRVWFEPVDLHLDRFWTHGVMPYGIHPSPVEHAANENYGSDIRRDTVPEKKDREYRFRRKLFKMRDRAGMRIANLPYLFQWEPYA